MKTGAALMAFCAAFSVLALATQPAAAKSPAMEACSKQWDDMKTGGRPGTRLRRASGADAARTSQPRTGPRPPRPKPAKAEKTFKKVAATHDEDDTAIPPQQKKDCDAKWDANKAKTGAHGWHHYFHFMSNCI